METNESKVPESCAEPPRSPADAAKSRWLRLGVADVLLLVLVLGILQRSQGSMLDDPGLGWHLRHIDAMSVEGGWLTADPFSGPRGGQPWRTNQWVGDFLLYLGWWWGGLEGIAAVTTIILGLTFWGLYHLLLRDDVPWPIALGWTVVAVLGTSLSWVARPNVLTLPFVMLTAWTLDRYHRGRCGRAATWWLVPLFAVWANTHGGFIAGFIIVTLTMAVEAALCAVSVRARPAAWQRLRHLSCLLGACLLATLLNPYGWQLYPWIFQLLGNTFFMNLHGEWLSPNFHNQGAFRFELIILALPVLLVFGRRRHISLVALAQSIVWLHFALNGQRYISLWVVISVPLLARLSVDAIRRLTRSANLSQWTAAAAYRPANPLGVLLIVLALFTWARFTDGFARHDPRHVPVKALSYVLDHHSDQVVFHEYGWGGWLTWHGWPDVKNWIDDRNEVQGQAHIEQYFRIIQARTDWQEALARHNAQVACIPADCALAERMADHPAWQQRYRDSWAVVFEKTTGYSAQPVKPERTELAVSVEDMGTKRKLSFAREGP